MLYTSPMSNNENHHDDTIRRVTEAADDIENKFVKQKALKNLLEHGKIMLEMVKDYAARRYREVPYWAIGAISLALLYVINPLDVVPDVLFGIGYLDDATVIAFCLRLIEKELEKYRAWKAKSGQDSKIVDV